MVRYVGRDHCGCVYACVCVCVFVDWFVCVGACLCVGVYPWVRGCVCGCWCEVWDGFVCVCGRVAPTSSHTPTHKRTPAHRNKSCIHPHANPTIHPYTNPHKPTHPTQRHTHTHVHTLPVAKVPVGVHWGGGGPRVLGQMRGCTRVKFVCIRVNSREIHTKVVRISYEFT